MKAFLIKLPILSAIAIIVAAVSGMGFGLLSIPLAVAGYLVGWALRWVLIQFMKIFSHNVVDQLISILLPLIGAFVGAVAGGSF
jgi:NhaP-type Na+/H+ or K+/H+ antiporter